MSGSILLWGFEIGFDDLVAICCAGVGDRDGRGEWIASLQSLCGELYGAIGELGVAEAVAESPQGLALEVAISTTLEPVVSEGGQAVQRGVEGDGQAAGGVV